MMLSIIPSPQKEHATQMHSSVLRESGNKPESLVIPTPKDRLIIALESLIMLLFLAGMTFGATSILHAGYIGWFAILAVICFAVITINVLMFLNNSQENHTNEQPRK